MLLNETVKQFAMLRLIFDANASGPCVLPRKAIEDMEAEATVNAEKLRQLPYDTMCQQCVDLLKEVHAANIPGIGKMWLANKAAKEDAERFGPICYVMQQDLIKEVEGE